MSSPQMIIVFPICDTLQLYLAQTILMSFDDLNVISKVNQSLGRIQSHETKLYNSFERICG